MLVAVSAVWLHAQEPRGGAAGPVAIDPDDIGGIVRSPNGSEAGVWVIAETRDLPTRFIKTVVTDQQGRYVLPDLPGASYQIFVRGYGLIDSPRVVAKPGQQLDLKAVVAPSGKAAAEYYPAASWLSLMEIPKGKLSEREVVVAVKGCFNCHEVGTKRTREIPSGLRSSTASSLEAWDRRTGLPGMTGAFSGLGPQRKMFADWTDAIAAGAYPTQAPPRPTGAARNVVISQWDWAWPQATRSDSVATNEDNPRLNASGPVYGVYSNGTTLNWVDPTNSTAGQIETAVAGLRSLAMDTEGRVWFTGQLPQGKGRPEFCTAASGNKYERYFPLGGRSKQVVTFDPKTKQVTRIPTCQAVDHNYLGKEADKPLYFGQDDTVGWVSTATWDKTNDAAASQGWCPAVVDTNGDGTITEWTEPDQPLDPKKDRRVKFGCYSIGVSPVDGSVWCSGIDPGDNKLVRFERGPNPPLTCKAEVFTAPAELRKMPAYRSGGVAVDVNGVAWIGWRGSDQVTSFDRRKCKTTKDPKATGEQCPEGWTSQTMTRPTFKGATIPAHADEMYLTQTDRHNVLGLGSDVVVSGVVNTDSLQLFVPKMGQFVDLVIPYPLGFFSRSSNGRVDDPNTGWKGRGLWSNTSTYAPMHMEGDQPANRVVKFQMRPNPLSK